MALDKLNLDQLKQLKSKLEVEIARNPNHSRMQQSELNDVKQMIELRMREQVTSEPTF